MKDYIYCGRRFQFDDQDVPEGAVPVSEVKTDTKVVDTSKNKEATPTNKSKKVAKK